jgi:His-Xaa-Ser system radical SAM maturase HxsB
MHLHNLNRPKGGNDSYQRATNGISLVKERLGPDRVSALMTTTVESLKYPKEIIDEYVSQGFNSIFLRSLSPYGFAIKTKSYDLYNTETWINFYKQGLDYILDMNKKGHFFVEEYTSLILQKMLTPFPTGFVDLQSPSGIGISAIIFNYDGDVYASDESRMLAEMGIKDFRLGNLKKDSYEDMITSDFLVDAIKNSLLEGVPMCTDCAFLPYCGSDPVYHSATQGDIIGHKVKSGYCKKNMSVFKHIIKLLTDDEKAREILMRWIRI